MWTNSITIGDTRLRQSEQQISTAFFVVSTQHPSHSRQFSSFVFVSCCYKRIIINDLFFARRQKCARMIILQLFARVALLNFNLRAGAPPQFSTVWQGFSPLSGDLLPLKRASLSSASRVPVVCSKIRALFAFPVRSLFRFFRRDEDSILILCFYPESLFFKGSSSSSKSVT